MADKDVGDMLALDGDGGSTVDHAVFAVRESKILPFPQTVGQIGIAFDAELAGFFIDPVKVGTGSLPLGCGQNLALQVDDGSGDADAAAKTVE